MQIIKSMEILNTFDPKTTEVFINRIEKLTPETKSKWGKMNVAQMLAHVCVSYDMAYGKVKPKYNFLTKFMLKTFVKGFVVGKKPYKKSSQTAPAFVIADERNFKIEKDRLIANIKLTESKGASHFEGLESSGFGVLTAKEWSNLFAKHLDHHLTQFGV